MDSLSNINEELETLLNTFKDKSISRVSKYVPLLFTEKQQQVYDNDCHELLAEGSAGSGKSVSLLAAALKYIDHPKYAALILRRQFPQLIQSGGIMDLANDWLSNTDAIWTASDKTWNFPSGATLSFGHMNNENDKTSYQGGSWQFIGFDELTQFSETQYLYLHSRLRKDDYVQTPLRIRSTTNPGGLHNRWVKKRFIVPEKLNPTIQHISMQLDDNPHINKETYLEGLNKLDDDTKAQLRDGKWLDNTTGIIYTFPEENELQSIPNLPKPVYILAVDLGASQIKATTGFVLLGYSEEIKDLVVVIESKAYAGLTVSDIAELIKSYQEQYDLNEIIMDQGALGIGYINELNDRWHIPASGVQKANKLGYRKLLSSAIKNKQIRIVTENNQDLIEELRTLPWNSKGLDAHDGYPDHLSDALLYAYRQCLDYLSKAPAAKSPNKGDEGWSDYEENRMWDAMSHDDKISKDSPWWRQDRRRRR